MMATLQLRHGSRKRLPVSSGDHSFEGLGRQGHAPLSPKSAMTASGFATNGACGREGERRPRFPVTSMEADRLSAQTKLVGKVLQTRETKGYSVNEPCRFFEWPKLLGHSFRGFWRACVTKSRVIGREDHP